MSLAPTSVTAGVREAVRGAAEVVGKWLRRIREAVRVPAILAGEAGSQSVTGAVAWARKNPRRARQAMFGGLSCLAVLTIAAWPGGDDRSLLVAAV